MTRPRPILRAFLWLAWLPFSPAGLSYVPAGDDATARATESPRSRGPARSGDSMVLQSFNGPAVPLNQSGGTYPSIYTGEGSAGSVRVDTSNAVEGNSLAADVTAKGLYLQFNPFAANTRGFARDYSANPAGWQFNTYDRLSFWVLRPTAAAPLGTGGQNNVEFGTYVKRVTNADPTSDEAGGGHYYHELNLPNTGQWTQVIINMHPAHQRGAASGVDAGYLPHPTATGGPNGGADPAGTYNYFDALTRFYIDDTSHPATGTYRVDEVRFYRETARENDAQVFSLTATYDPSRNRLIVTWNRALDENDIKHEVRYSFTDIHRAGWKAARPAPRGLITPPGWQGYNGMVYDTAALLLAGHPVVYIAVKPQNSNLFSQIAVPLSEGRHRR